MYICVFVCVCNASQFTMYNVADSPLLRSYYVIIYLREGANCCGYNKYHVTPTFHAIPTMMCWHDYILYYILLLAHTPNAFNNIIICHLYNTLVWRDKCRLSSADITVCGRVLGWVILYTEWFSASIITYTFRY